MSGGGTLFWVGDSLTVQSPLNGPSLIMADLVSLGYVANTTARIDGLVGRSINQNTTPFPSPGSKDVIATQRAGGYHFNRIVVELSSNDFDVGLTALKARMFDLIATINLETVQQILWIGPAIQPVPTVYTPAQIATINTALSQVAAVTPTMLWLDLQAQFNAIPAGTQAGWWNDDRHMTSTGYPQRNSIIKTWIAAQPFTSTAVRLYRSGLGDSRKIRLYEAHLDSSSNATKIRTYRTGLSSVVNPVKIQLYRSGVTSLVASAPPQVSTDATTLLVEAGAPFTLTGSATDPDGTIVSRSWKLNGVVQSTTDVLSVAAAPVSMTDQTFTYVYSATDNSGLTSSTSVSVTVYRATAWRKNGDGTFTPFVLRRA